MEHEELLSMQELADRIGCTTQAIRESMRTDGLPGRKIGSRWFFAWSEVIRWVGAGSWKSEKARRAVSHDDADANTDEE